MAVTGRRSRLLRFWVERRGAENQRGVGRGLQLGAAPRQPRPGAATHVSTEANCQSRVYFATVYLKGELTAGASHQACRVRGWRVLALGSIEARVRASLRDAPRLGERHRHA